MDTRVESRTEGAYNTSGECFCLGDLVTTDFDRRDKYVRRRVVHIDVGTETQSGVMLHTETEEKCKTPSLTADSDWFRHVDQ